VRNEEAPPRVPLRRAPPTCRSPTRNDPPIACGRVAATRMRGIRVRVNGSKVPYSLPGIALPVREETGRCIDDIRHFRPENGSEPMHRSGLLRRRRLGWCEASVRHLGERAHLQFDEFRAVRQGHRCGRHAHLTIPVAEHHGGRFGMPRRAQVLVASSNVGEEHAIRGRFGHALSMPPAGGSRQRDSRRVSAVPCPAATTWGDTSSLLLRFSCSGSDR
jgi:hypothetical protein